MKYIVFTFDGYGLPIAWQLQQEGREVLVAQVHDQSDCLSELEKNIPAEHKTGKARRLSLYDGLLEKSPAGEVMQRIRKINDPENYFVFFDLNHLCRYAEQVAELGFHGNFPTTRDYVYEIDRNLAKEFVEKEYPGVVVGSKKRFNKVSAAKSFLEKSDELWVLKGLEEDARTVVPDVEDTDLARGQIIEALTNSADEYESAGFILELRIPSAIELTPQKLYYNGEPVTTLMCIENKPFGAGNIGPMTDCAQDLVFATDQDEKINIIAFPPAVDEMAKQRKGLFVWDASLLIDSRSGKMYFGEFCGNRHGYNTLYSEIALAGSPSKYFESLVAGKTPYADNAVATSVRLTNLHTDADGRPLAEARIEYKPNIEKNLWLRDAKGIRKNFVSAGYKADLAVITGAGRSTAEAATKMYRNVDGFSFEGAYYRPMFDFCSREYKTSIVNRLEYGLQKGLFKIGFGLG
jgi:hypothetical protein